MSYNNTSNELNNEELLRLIKQKLQYTNSSVYDSICDQFSSVSYEDDIIIREPTSEITDESSLFRQFQKRKRRWKYSCNKSDKWSLRPKTCVCIVSASQRRIQIGEQGCLSCHCTGCSIEDETKTKKIKKKKKSSSVSSSDDSLDFKTVNG